MGRLSFLHDVSVGAGYYFLRLKLWFGTGRWGTTDKRLCYNTLYYFSLSFNYHDRKDSDDFFLMLLPYSLCDGRGDDDDDALPGNKRWNAHRYPR